MLRRVTWLLLMIIITLLFPGSEGTVAASKTIDKQPSKIQIIDRTDYPVLYLDNPELQGDAVWILQAELKELGYDIEVNGVYNVNTSKIVELFQVSQDMKDTGVANKDVWEALMSTVTQAPVLAGKTENIGAAKKYIEIDLATRKLTVFENGVPVVKFPVAVGKSDTPSPLGEWKIAQKCLNWGDGFGTRWLGLNVPWGIFGIHGTNKPGSIGSYASHGCIRMFNRDVEKLYPLIPLGTTVRIVDNGKIFPHNMKSVHLKKNSFGQNVVYVQSRLKELGLEFDRADGRYGNMTELAVKYFQIWHDLKPTGEMDEDTYRAMQMII